MSSKSAVGPNDPCPCGSNKKYKRCCKSVEGPVRVKWRPLVLGALVAAGVAVLIFGPASRSKGDTSVGFGSGLGTRAGTLVPQPSGAVPAGKVWSPEHGHWHDAAAAASVLGSDLPTQAGVPALAGRLTPQPLGAVPEGKVWSPEHGHWHNAPGAGSVLGSGVPIQVGGLTPQPLGAVPEGKVWSPEHGHWHNIPGAGSVLGSGVPIQVGLPTSGGGLTPQPPGAVPEGKVWSPEHGHWHTDLQLGPAPGTTSEEAPITIQLDSTP